MGERARAERETEKVRSNRERVIEKVMEREEKWEEMAAGEGQRKQSHNTTRGIF